MKPLRHIAILLLLTLCVAGCHTDKQTLALIDHAEQIVKEYPDSAYNILSAIDPDRLRTKHDRMRHGLVQCESIYYDNVDIQSDSLTRQLFDYYLDSDLHSERARAMYQHAMVNYCENNNAEAVYAFTEAEKSLNFVDNPRLKGLIYLYMGEIYGAECHFKNAYDLYLKAQGCFAQTDLEFHQAVIIYRLGEILIHSQNYDEAKTYLLEAKEITSSKGYDGYLSFTLHALADLYIQTLDIEKCIEIFEYWDANNCKILFHNLYYYYRSICEAYCGNRAKALEYMELADNNPDADNYEAEYYKYLIYKYLGDSAEATYWLEQNKLQQERYLISIMEQPILNIRLDAITKSYEAARDRVLTMRYQQLSILLAICVILLPLSIYIRYRIVKQRHDIERYIGTINELRTTINARRDDDQQSQSIYTLFGNQFDDINTLCEIYYEHSETGREASKILEQVMSCINAIKSDDNRLAQLENIVNHHHNNIIARLRQECPKLNTKEVRFILYFLAGFSNRSICILLDSDIAALSRLKYKIKQKLSENGCSEAQREIFGER